MKIIVIVAAAAMMLGGMSLTTHPDKKKQKKETRGEQWMKRITTNDPDSLDMLIEEMAAAGDYGMRDVVQTFIPPQEGESTVQQYAIRSVVDYVLSPKGAKYRDGVRTGLTRTFERSMYEPQRIFLLSQLARCATAEDMPLFVACLEDRQVAGFAMQAIAAMPGIEKEVEQALRDSAAPRVSLARLIEARGLKGCDDLLASWTTGADTVTLRAIYSAMAVTGSDKSLSTLAKAAGAVGFGQETTHATKAFISLLDRLSESASAATRQGARTLLESGNAETQCHGLRLWLKETGADGIKEMVAALKQSDIGLQRTALEYGAKYCGQGVFGAVAAAFGKLPATARIEVLKWYGDHRVSEGVSDIVKIIDRGKGVELSAAMTAAARIGDEAAVEALVARLGKKDAEEAKAALLVFDGDISECLVKALSSKNKKVVLNVLPIASARKVKGCYDIVIKYAMSDDKQLSEAALAALGGMAGPENYADLCRMIEEADDNHVPVLQRAAVEAVKTADAQTQYDMAEKAMRASAKPSRYYLLMARSGTDKAMQTLMNENNEEARKALLELKNPKMLPVLADMANRTRRGEERDRVLERYISVCDGMEATPEERYLMLAEADAMGPSEMLRDRLITSMGHTHTIQALAYMRRYYDNPKHIDAVAGCVKDILTASPGLNGGKNVKAMLLVAHSVYDDKRIDDPEADIIVDSLNAMMAKSAATGYVMSTEQTKMGKRGFWMIKDNFEDFDLSFDWRTTDFLTVQLRSIPLLTFDDKRGAQISESDEWRPYDRVGRWNTADIHVSGSRVSVSVNGHKLFSDITIPAFETVGNESITGYIGFGGGSDSLIVRNTRIRKLPSSRPRATVQKAVPTDDKGTVTRQKGKATVSGKAASGSKTRPRRRR